jgi:omega-6 fatty acid desaturase (delta-12 desaturase)
MYIYSDDEIEKIVEITQKYEANDYKKPILLLIGNFVILGILIYILYLSTTSYEYLPISFSITILISLFIARNFMCFHDLCHSSFFPSNERKEKSIGINAYIAYIFDFIFGYPAKKWKDGHSEHHKVHGNIDEYDAARTFLNSDEYNKLSDTHKKIYDVIRNPFIFFIFGQIYIFYISHITSFNIFYIVKLIIFLFLIKTIFNVETMIFLIIAYYIGYIFGTMLFHLQHAINEPYWKKITNYNEKMNAELNDSSVLKIPNFLKIFTNGIEYHNVHHVNPGVPCYNIQRCYEELIEKNLLKNKEVGFSEMVESLGYTIYDIELDKYK